MMVICLNGKTDLEEALHDEECNLGEIKQKNASRRRQPLALTSK